MRKSKRATNKDDVYVGSNRMDFFRGKRGDDTISGLGGHDFLKGGRGNDIIDGGAGNDLVLGGRGNDIVKGGAGNDLVLGDGLSSMRGYFGWGRKKDKKHDGDDQLDGGAGNDWVFGGGGDDLLNYNVQENIGAKDLYDGGSGNDTLKIGLTLEEWMNPAFQQDLASYLVFIKEPGYGKFQFTAFDLTASGITTFLTSVNGIATNPIDEAATAFDDNFVLDENGTVSGNVLDNNGQGADEIPDLLRGVTLTNQSNDELTLRADGNFTYTNGVQFDYLAEGETASVQYQYQIEDADGDTSVAMIELTIRGKNDAPTLEADLHLLLSEDTMPSSIDLTAGVSDVDASDSLSIVNLSQSSGRDIDVLLDGVQLNILSANFNDLAEGEQEDVTFDFDVVDTQGASVSQSLTLSVSGTNDMPSVQYSLEVMTDEEQAAFTVNLLEGATDIDNNAQLNVTNFSEAGNQGGWELLGNDLLIDPNHFDNLHDGESSTLSLQYEVTDEHGASVAQTLTVDIAGFTDAPSLMVKTAATDKINQIAVTVSVTPARDERVGLTFTGLPLLAKIFDLAGNEIKAAITDFVGTETYYVELPENQDTKVDILVEATGYRSDGEAIGTANQSLDVSYEVAQVTDSVTFASENQNMWAAGQAPQIGWHEYIPILGTKNSAWESGDFTLVEVGLDSSAIADQALVGLQAVVALAEGELLNATTTLIQAEQDKATALSKLHQVEGVVAAWADFSAKDVVYFAAKTAYDAVGGVTQTAFTEKNNAQTYLTTLNGYVNDAHTAAVNAENAMLATAYYIGPAGPFYDLGKIAEKDAAWTHHNFTVLDRDKQQAIFDGVNQTYIEAAKISDPLFEVMTEVKQIKDAAYTHADNLQATMWNAGFYSGQSVSAPELAAATAEYSSLIAHVEATKVPVVAAQVAIEAAQLAYDTALDAVNNIDLNADIKVDVSLSAKVGLQLDFALDAGSVDASIDYIVTTETQHNKTTDQIKITPFMQNATTDEKVAFTTISPNMTFYASIIYDLSAEITVDIDANASLGGINLFDLDLDQPITQNLTKAGEIVLIDYDSADTDSIEVPFIETLSEDIVSIELGFPTVETEGTASEFSPEFFQEGAFYQIDFSEISSAFFNLVNSELALSPEVQALLDDLGPLELGSSEQETFDAALGQIMEAILNSLSPDSDTDGDGIVPIFIIDASDETSSALLHVNLFEDNSTVTPDTGAMGFFVAYGESDKIIEVTLDIDQVIAFAVNLALGNASGEVINPFDLELGLNLIMNLIDVPKAAREEITKYVDLSLTFEALDLESHTGWNFSQEFSLSVDDMAFAVTMEDGEIYLFDANTEGSILINNASQHDVNKDGTVEYQMSLVPLAMFSNDTELGMSIGYTMDMIKADLSAGINLKLSELTGIAALPNFSYDLLNVNFGPLIRVEAELDYLKTDVYESRFSFDLGSDQVNGSFSVTDDQITGTAGDDFLEGNQGNDIISGSSGNDVIVGGQGDDVLSGGSGEDVFVFNTGDGHDRIEDFSADDTLDLIALGISDTNDDASIDHNDLTLHEVGDDLIIDLGTENQIILVGVSLDEFSTSQFTLLA